MGRLFWKFFFSIWVAQAIAVLCISGGIWLKDRHLAQLAESLELAPPASLMLDAAEVTLRSGGLSALKELLEKNRHAQVYALNVQGRDLLDRPVNPAIVEKVLQLHGQNAYTHAIRTLVAPDGSSWLMYIARRTPCCDPDPYHNEGPPGGPRPDSALSPDAPLPAGQL